DRGSPRHALPVPTVPRVVPKEVYGFASAGRGADQHQCVVNVSVMLWLKLPEVPLIVMVNVPTLAALEALTVSVLPVVAGLGRNEAVTPFSKPDTDSVTLLLKLLSRLIVMVLVPLLPRAMVRELGESERLKSGCGPSVIVSDTVVLCERLPDVPVMVIVNVPTAAVDEADRRRVLEVAVGFGPKEAVTPVGIPDAVKLTLPEKLSTG